MQFTDEYQREVLSRLSDRKFLSQVHDVLRADVFDPVYEPIITAVVDKWRKKESILTWAQLKQLAARHDVKLSPPGGEHGDLDFDREELLVFAKHRMFRTASMDAMLQVERGNFDKAFQILMDSRKRMPGVSADKLENSLLSNKPMPVRRKLIYSGILPLDHPGALGGVGAGDLCMMMAPTSGGKTSLMVHLACSALEQGKKVFYATLEVGAEEIEGKARRRLTGQERPSTALWQKTGKALDRKGAKLWVRHHSPFSRSAMDLEVEIPEEADLVVIDYADYLKPPSGDPGLSYYDLGLIYADLKRMAFDRDISVLTATQVNRASYKGDERLEVDSVESSLKKAMLVDQAVSINQNRAERQPDEDTGNCVGSLYIAKNRHGPRFVDVPVTINWATCSFKEGRFD